MISFRKNDYNTSENVEQVFSRLAVAVERVNGLMKYLLGGVTVETNRPWVGTFDESEMKFNLVEPARFFNFRFIHIIVRGKIFSEEGKTKISIKLRLGWFTLFVTLSMYIGAIVVILFAILSPDAKNIGNLIIWVLVFPVPWTFVLNWKINRVEKKIKHLFGV